MYNTNRIDTHTHTHTHTYANAQCMCNTYNTYQQYQLFPLHRIWDPYSEIALKIPSVLENIHGCSIIYYDNSNMPLIEAQLAAHIQPTSCAAKFGLDSISPDGTLLPAYLHMTQIFFLSAKATRLWPEIMFLATYFSMGRCPSALDLRFHELKPSPSWWRMANLNALTDQLLLFFGWGLVDNSHKM